MIIKLTSEEQREIVFSHVGPRTLSKEYLDEREKVWNKRTSEAQEKGQLLWNGEVYTIESIIQFDESRIVVELGSSEYKDIVFRSQFSTEKILEVFGTNHILNFITLDCIPTTTDGKAVFGVRAKGTYVQEGALGLIGGTLNKDEMTVKTMEDITDFMMKEVAEETAITLQRNSLQLFSINFFRSKYEFLYTFKLNQSSKEIKALHKEGEFSELVAFDLNELEQSHFTKLDTVRFCRNYLQELLLTR
jgi:hypothetical protein